MPTKTDDKAFYDLPLAAQFEEYFAHIGLTEEPEKTAMLMDLLKSLQAEFPELRLEFRWYQPMLLLKNEGKATFIASFSLAKNWLNFAAENYTQADKNPVIVEKKYKHTAKFVQFPYKTAPDLDFITSVIRQQIADKRGSTRFWKEN